MLCLGAALYAGQALATGETRINTVGYDLPSLTLVIDGVRFADQGPPNGRKPYVEFGGTPVTVVSWAVNSLTVKLPTSVSEGEYQSYVERVDKSGQTPHIGVPVDAKANYSLTVKNYDAIKARKGIPARSDPRGQRALPVLRVQEALQDQPGPRAQQDPPGRRGPQDRQAPPGPRVRQRLPVIRPIPAPPPRTIRCDTQSARSNFVFPRASPGSMSKPGAAAADLIRAFLPPAAAVAADIKVARSRSPPGAICLSGWAAGEPTAPACPTAGSLSSPP